MKRPIRTDGKRGRAVLLRILRETKPIRGYLILSALISAVSVTLVLICPELLGSLTNVLYALWAEGAAVDMRAFLLRCALLAVLYLIASLCDIGVMYIMNHVVSRRFTCALRIRISEKIAHLPVRFADETPGGEVISRMTNDVSEIGNTVHNFLNLTISGVLKLVGIVAVVFWMQPLMACAVVVFVPLSLLLSAVIAEKSEKHFGAHRKTLGKIYAFTEEDFTGFDAVKAFHLEARQNARHAALCKDARDRFERAVYLGGVVQPIVAVTNNIAYILICLLGGYLTIRGTLRVGDVVAFILYAKLFAAPLESIASGLSTVQRTIASANRVYELFDAPEMDEMAGVPVPDGAAHIRFEHVDFSYDPEKPLIEDLNMDVAPGRKVAIVGPTGGGKTTIVNLLMRFYDPDAGRITLNGTNTRSMDRAALRARCSMVLQDTWLFSGTIYDNIAYGKQGATREEVLEAARRAHIDHFIDTLPDGYDTVINEESTNISGGQKQMLTIARAYLANRSILILDEATSNVDTRTELLIQRSMDELMQGRTSFVIAHRLSTIVDADVILVVDNGRIVEQGTHRELLAKNGFYAEIYNSQYALLK